MCKETSRLVLDPWRPRLCAHRFKITCKRHFSHSKTRPQRRLDIYWHGFIIMSSISFTKDTAAACCSKPFHLPQHSSLLMSYGHASIAYLSPQVCTTAPKSYYGNPRHKHSVMTSCDFRAFSIGLEEWH